MSTATLYKTSRGKQLVLGIYDKALQNWPVPYDAQTVPTRHGDTFVVSSGSTHLPAMILLHGAGSNLTVWGGEVEQLSRHYRIHAPDLIGEAGKSAPNRPPWEGSAFCEWLEDVLTGLNVTRATLVGISQGAWVALKLATAMPEQVDKLVLIAPGGVVPDRSSFLLRAVVLMMLGNWGIRRMVRALFGEQDIPEGVEDAVIQITNQFKPRIGTLPIFTDEELKELKMPTLVLGGTKDIIRDTDKIAARLKKHVPDLTVHMIPGAGHALINTGAMVTEFLRK